MVILISVLIIQPYGVTTSRVRAVSSASASANVTQLWSFPTFGSVYTVPTVVDGYVYVNSYFDQSSRGGVFCLNASTGERVWNYTTDYVSEGRPFRHVVADDRVYFTVQTGFLFCLDAYTGAKLWNVTGPVGYPVVANNYLYVSGLGIWCLNPLTGAEVWSYPTEEGVGLPVVSGGYVFANGWVSREPAQGIVYCFDAYNGNRIWSYTPKEFPDYPAVDNGYVYVGAINYSQSGPDGHEAAVYALNATNGSEIWSFPIGKFSSENPNFVPVAAGNLVYVSVGNKTYALDSSTGAERWALTSQDPVSFPLFSNPYVYVTSGGNVHCLDAFTGTQKWTFRIEGDEASSLVIADGQVYVGSVGSQYFAKSVYHSIYALDALSGDRLWNYTIEGNPYSITVADGTVYVGTSFATTENADFEGNGTVYALKPTATSPSSTTFTELQQILIVVVVIGVILAVLVLIYKIRRKQ